MNASGASARERRTTSRRIDSSSGKWRNTST
jgi:hypothetical protein